MISFDHVAVWSRNHYRTTVEITNETGLPSRDGGYFPEFGLGQKYIPIADDIYIEVEGPIDLDIILRGDDPTVELLLKQTRDGDCFMGWCLRTDSLEELERFAAHHRAKVLEAIPGGKIDMSGESPSVRHSPGAMQSWPVGRPNLYYTPDLSKHACAIPASRWTGSADPKGLLAIEIGGTEQDLIDWFGDIFHPRDFPFGIIYNNKEHGLYAMTLDTTEGEKVLRLSHGVRK